MKCLTAFLAIAFLFASSSAYTDKYSDTIIFRETNDRL